MDLPFSVLSQVTATLQQEGIRYVLVGSFASSIHGMYRSTADIDILAEIKTEHVRPLFQALQKSFYVDEQVMREAIAQRRSFNAIHFDSVFKVDFFIANSDDFALVQLDRRELRSISPVTGETVYVATAEDTILAKLRWYRSGNETSNTQWNDVLGILATSKRNLDINYVRAWSEKFGLNDLLEKALAEVQEDPGI
jgi:predicted nucleotidyltransferase